MILPAKAITEFAEIYQRKFGETLTLDEASFRAENFLRLMVLITEGSQKTNFNIDLNKK